MSTLNLDVIEGFRNYLIEKEKTEATIEKYVHDITMFACWLGEREIDMTSLVEYKSELQLRLSPRSVNTVISALNCLLKYLGSNLNVKTLVIQRRIFADNQKELSYEEYTRLITAAMRKGNERLSLIIQTICATGIRVSELQYITVEALAIGRAEINCKGKLRVIFLPGGLCRILKKYAIKKKIKKGPVLVTKSGKPLDRSNIWSGMKRLCASAGVNSEKVFPHNLRHLFARTFYSKERDIVRLADILGHSSVNTTRIYTMESGREHRKIMESLNLLI